MIKLHPVDMSFEQAINAALDIAQHCRKQTVSFEYQGVNIIAVTEFDNVCLPRVKTVETIKDFSDEILIKEFYQRVMAKTKADNNSLEAVFLRAMLEDIIDPVPKG